MCAFPHEYFLVQICDPYFSGCCDRVGRDIDLNTTSRYFVGLKIARIHDKRKYDGSIPTEYFVETSQSFVSVKPILMAEFKENIEP